jgi:predicted  nucleic acid-binding Zn-ribbon protein
MERVDGMLKGLEVKVQQFADLYVKVKQEKDQLINQSVIQQKTIEEQNKEIERLRSQVRQLSETKKEESEIDAGEVKERISSLVREIDRCIELINK